MVKLSGLSYQCFSKRPDVLSILIQASQCHWSKNNKVPLLHGHEGEKKFDLFFHYPMTAITKQRIKMAIRCLV